MAAPFPSPTRTWHSNTYPSLSPTRPELSAKGKTILITGGGTGIGAGIARSFAEAGASRIALLGRREQPLLDTKASIEAAFPAVDVFTASTDITNHSSVDKAFAAFLGDNDNNNNKLHVLVSNAAMGGPLGRVDNTAADEIAAGVDSNVKGSLHVAQAFLHFASADAVVVDVSSSAAHLDFGGQFASYSIAKMAIIKLWDSVASAHPELSVFHIQPGVVDTDMNRAAGGIAALGFEDHVSLPATFSVWLASPEARFLKGKFLWANWDVDELKARAGEIQAGTQFNIGLNGWPFASGEWKAEVPDGWK